MASNDEYQQRHFFKQPKYTTATWFRKTHEIQLKVNNTEIIKFDLTTFDLPIVEESYQKHLRLRQTDPNYGVKINNPYDE